MKKLSTRQKISFLKKAKVLLKKNWEDKCKSYGGNLQHMGTCVCLMHLLGEEYNYPFCSDEAQDIFEMRLVKPSKISQNVEYMYWWTFTQRGYEARQKALNILINHFEGKIKHKYKIN